MEKKPRRPDPADAILRAFVLLLGILALIWLVFMGIGNALAKSRFVSLFWPAELFAIWFFAWAALRFIDERERGRG